MDLQSQLYCWVEAAAAPSPAGVRTARRGRLASGRAASLFAFGQLEIGLDQCRLTHGLE